MISVAVTVNLGNAFPTHSNFLVWLNTRGYLWTQRCHVYYSSLTISIVIALHGYKNKLLLQQASKLDRRNVLHSCIWTHSEAKSVMTEKFLKEWVKKEPCMACRPWLGFVQPALPLPVPTTERTWEQAGHTLPDTQSWPSLKRDTGRLRTSMHLCNKEGVSAVPHQFMPKLFHIKVLTVILIVSYKPWHLAVPPSTACATEMRRSEWISAPFLLNTELFWT